MNVSDLPAINAGLNGLSTVLLTFGYIAIRSGAKPLHGKCMAAAFLVSLVFLGSYVTHKILVGGLHTSFGGEGWIRGFYYTMLFSHIVLAIVIVPLVATTLYFAITRNWEKHRPWAKVTFPIWYYVSVTGVLVYFFLYRWFPAAG